MTWLVRRNGVWEEVTEITVIDSAGAERNVIRGEVFKGGAWRRVFPTLEATSTVISSGLTGTVLLATARTVTGSVTSAFGDITGGTVTIQQRVTGTSTWTNVGTSATLGSGPVVAFSVTVTPTLCGSTQFRAVYSGTLTNMTSTSSTSSVTVSVGTAAKPTGGTITTTSAAISWPAVAGATSYEVYRNNALVATTTSLSHTSTGLATGTTYTWKVRAKAGTCVGAFSPDKQGRTARNEVTDSGTATVTVDPSVTGSYRPDVDWGYIGDRVGQGYYSSSSRNYSGVIDYGGATRVRGIIEAALGSNGDTRFDNCVVTGARVYLYKRSGVGSAGPVTASFYVSSAVCNSGGQPSRSGTVVNDTTASGGAGKWQNIGTAHGTAIAKGTHRSVVLYNLGTTNYLQMDGKSSASNRCDLQLDLSWNYVLTAAVAGAWLN